MKNLCLVMVISLYLSACESSRELKKFPTIDQALVAQMFQHYKMLPHDIATNIIQMISLPHNELKKLTKFKNDFRLIVTAYVADNTYGKKDSVAIIMQLWRKGIPMYYDLNAIFAHHQVHGLDGTKTRIMYKVICPPPTPCDITKNPATD